MPSFYKLGLIVSPMIELVILICLLKVRKNNKKKLLYFIIYLILLGHGECIKFLMK